MMGCLRVCSLLIVYSVFKFKGGGEYTHIISCAGL